MTQALCYTVEKRECGAILVIRELVDAKRIVNGKKWEIAMRPGKRRQLARDEALVEKLKPVRASGASIPVVKHFGYSKARYRGLAKNTQRLAVLLGFTNLIRAERCMTAS